MGIFGDVYAPIRDLIEPTEGLDYLLIAEKLQAIIHPVERELIDLNLNALYTRALNALG